LRLTFYSETTGSFVVQADALRNGHKRLINRQRQVEFANFVGRQRREVCGFKCKRCADNFLTAYGTIKIESGLAEISKVYRSAQRHRVSIGAVTPPKQHGGVQQPGGLSTCQQIERARALGKNILAQIPRLPD